MPRHLPDGFVNARGAADHLKCSEQTLMNCRKANKGPLYYRDEKGWCAYRIEDLDTWKNKPKAVFTPVETHDQKVEAVVPKVQTGPTKENKGIWLKEGAREKWFPNVEAMDAWDAARRGPMPQVVIGPSLSSQEVREKFPILDNPHGFTLPERKPK